MRSKELIAMITTGALLGFGAALAGCEEGTMNEGADNVREGVDNTQDSINRGIDNTQDELDNTTTPNSTAPDTTTPNRQSPTSPTSPTTPPEEEPTTTP